MESTGRRHTIAPLKNSRELNRRLWGTLVYALTDRGPLQPAQLQLKEFDPPRNLQGYLWPSTIAVIKIVIFFFEGVKHGVYFETGQLSVGLFEVLSQDTCR